LRYQPTGKAGAGYDGFAEESPLGCGLTKPKGLHNDYCRFGEFSFHLSERMQIRPGPIVKIPALKVALGVRLLSLGQLAVGLLADAPGPGYA